ncbi:MAG: transporter substrate-binding domain-containing protein [Bacteroidales bacterium]|nr:transporter substrate-binding domain-containing protein [Bacteroidales bacterium]
MREKLILIISVLILVLASCSTPAGEKGISLDLDSIKARGRIVAVTDFNSTNYFLYRGEPMGFHYELLKSFADYLGLDLEIITENHLDHSFGLLNSGKADLLAIGLTVNASRRQEVLFTDPIDETRQVLVQRKPKSWRSLSSDALEYRLVRNQLDLAHKTVYVQKGSSHVERLHSLAREIGDSINIVEVPFEAETLIRNLNDGEIDYVVCDENIALVNATYYPDIDVATPVSFTQSLAWAVRKQGSEMLAEELNRWISDFRKTTSYSLLYSKYFRNARSSHIVKSDYYTLNTGRVSPYDEMIKGFSDSINWDWRLLASLICQESRFDAEVVSWAGAVGLMQIMPVTGERFGIDITASPENNMKAGIRYINWLQSVFEPKIADSTERLNFILASYNAGPGHVLDAMKLAGKNGMDPTVWKGSVEVWLQKKSQPEYYNDTVVRNGYFRGRESVAFVAEILDRYEHYKNVIPASGIEK